MLYDSNSARLLLGTFMIIPKLVMDGRFHLNKDDFCGSIYHLRLYQAIKYLASHGAEGISSIDLYGMVENNQVVKDIFDDNNTIDFVDTVKHLADINNVQLYYDAVKKCSLLNKYKENGFDISPFESSPSTHTIEEIVTYYDALQQKIKADYYTDESIMEIKAGDGWEDIKESFKVDPMYGASSFSLMVSECTRGWVRGQLTMFSAQSGSGKTAIGLYNLALVCCPRIWSYKYNAFVTNPYYQNHGGLYIQYELDIDKELTPKILASISGVPCYNILDNNYEEGEEARVDEAIEILHESNIRFITMPSYTITQLETYIRQYANLYDCKFVVMDYISENLSLANEFASGAKTNVRTDQVLAGVSGVLKNLARELNVAILTFTQTNANIQSNEEFGANVISGSRAIQNVLDVGGVLGKLRKREEEIVDMVMGNTDIKARPNRCATLFKMRFSKYPQGIKIYFNIDLNTGRVTEGFATTPDDRPISVKPLHLTYAPCELEQGEIYLI